MKYVFKISLLLILYLVLLNHSIAKDYAIVGSSIYAGEDKPELKETSSEISQIKSNLNVDLSRFWFNLGLGPSSAVDGSMAGGLSVNYNYGLFLVTARFLYNEEFRICVFGCNPSDNCYELSILSGLAYKTNLILASISAGLSYVYVNKYIDSYHKNFQRIGFPIDAQLFFRFYKYVGIGVNGFANLNSGHSFGGVLLCLQFGDLR